MADLYRLNAKFDAVKFDQKALMFHYDRKVSGAIDRLAVQCYQYVMQMETAKQLEQNKSTYERWKETQDDKDTGN